MTRLNSLGKLLIVDNYRCEGAKNLLFVFDTINYFFPIQDEQIEIDKVKLMKKDEVHLTLIGNDTGSLLYTMNTAQQNYLSEFTALANEIDGILQSEELKLTDKFTFLKRTKDDELRFSLIREIKTTTLDLVNNYLFQKYGVPFKESFAHVTLYKQKENIGIGLYSTEDYEKFKVRSCDTISKFF